MRMGGQNDYDVGVRAMRGFMADFPKEWIRTGGHFKVLAYRSLWVIERLGPRARGRHRSSQRAEPNEKGSFR